MRSTRRNRCSSRCRRAGRPGPSTRRFLEQARQPQPDEPTLSHQVFHEPGFPSASMWRNPHQDACTRRASAGASSRMVDTNGRTSASMSSLSAVSSAGVTRSEQWFELGRAQPVRVDLVHRVDESLGQREAVADGHAEHPQLGGLDRQVAVEFTQLQADLGGLPATAAPARRARHRLDQAPLAELPQVPTAVRRRCALAGGARTTDSGSSTGRSAAGGPAPAAPRHRGPRSRSGRDAVGAGIPQAPPHPRQASRSQDQ